MVQSDSLVEAKGSALSKILEGLKTWAKTARDVWASDVTVGDAPAQQAEGLDPARAGGRPQSGATVGIFVLLIFYFLYFAAPILIPIVTALLLSMLLAPVVQLLEWARVPRTLGSLAIHDSRLPLRVRPMGKTV